MEGSDRSHLAVSAPKHSHSVDPKSHEDATLEGAHTTLRALRDIWKAPVIVIDSEIDDELVDCLQRFLTSLGRRREIIVVLGGNDGSLVAARKAIHLLRAFSDSYAVVVPRRAGPAATLIALGASHIGMGVASELTAIGSRIAVGDPLDMSISAADVRSYFAVASSVVNLHRDRSRERAFLALCGDRMGVAIGALHRAEGHAKAMTVEALRSHLPRLKRKRLERLATQLVGDGVASPSILRSDAESLGLRITRVTDDELERASLLADVPSSLSASGIGRPGILLGPNFTAILPRTSGRACLPGAGLSREWTIVHQAWGVGERSFQGTAQVLN